MSQLRKRLDKLDAVTNPAEVRLILCELGETVEQAKARLQINGDEPGVEYMFVYFVSPPDYPE